jgi:hypothetical protein
VLSSFIGIGLFFACICMEFLEGEVGNRGIYHRTQNVGEKKKEEAHGAGMDSIGKSRFVCVHERARNGNVRVDDNCLIIAIVALWSRTIPVRD